MRSNHVNPKLVNRSDPRSEKHVTCLYCYHSILNLKAKVSSNLLTTAFTFVLMY